MKSNALKTTLGLLSASLLAGCGGEDPNTGSIPAGTLSYDTRTGITTDGTVDTRITARFLDAAVENLQYKSKSYNGSTSIGGSFSCASGEDVEFLIGSLSLGTATCQGIITPQTLAAKKTWEIVTGVTTTSASGGGGGSSQTIQETLANTPITNAEVINRVRLLMSLDTDSVTAGIQLPALTEQANVTVSSVDFTNTANFDSAVQTNVLDKIAGSTLVTATDATTHFQSTINGITDTNYNRSTGLYVDATKVAAAKAAEAAKNESDDEGYDDD
mgnify:CR=1 FL=1